MRKITLFILAISFSSCGLFYQNNTQMAEYINPIAFDGFIPENYQEILELIRTDIMLSEILKDSTRIAECVLENPDRNLLGSLSLGSSSYEEYMEEIKKVRPGLVNYIQQNHQSVIDIVKTRVVDENIPYDERFYSQLILKHVLQKNMEMPMLTQMELISQGADYYAYRFKILNYHEFDLASFSSYNPWYRVKFVFVNGFLDNYEYF